MNIGFEYIKYRWKAKRRHGIHSPFVYDFSDKCLSIKMDENSKRTLSSLKDTQHADSREINIQDYGAGSKKLGQKRKIKDIYSNSSSKGKTGKILFQLAQHYQPKNILELGTSLGIGTSHLLEGAKNSFTQSIEACPETYKVACENLRGYESSRLKLVNSTFHEFLKSDILEPKYDIIFIDGHHDGIALKKYLKALSPHLQDSTLIILDDIRWSDTMLSAWKEIVHDPKYKVTIDLFRIGIISPRPNQTKEHFIIRP